jgi:diguanylate cyclase (GGDEF)-like protein
MAPPPKHRRASLWSHFAIREDDPELARSQLAVLAKQLPLLYVLLCANSATLGLTHLSSTPLWLALGWPAIFSLLSLGRGIAWLRYNTSTKTEAQIYHQLRVILTMVVLMGGVSTVWGLSLYPFGDAYAKCHVAFYMAITVISVILCLTHLPFAALLLTCIVVIPFTLFFAMVGNPVLYAMILNLVLVAAGLIYIMLRNYKDFAALIVSERELKIRQADTQRLSDENFRLANLDSLTGLPNRRNFLAALDAALAQAQRDGSWFAVVIMDLDGFKAVNDSYGHVAGDTLLQAVGERLTKAAHPNTLIARLGGDEFGAIITASPTAEKLRGFGNRVCTAFDTSFPVGDGVATITCSLGAAIYPAGGHTAAELFEHADYALYHVKQTAKGSLELFSDHHQVSMRESGRVEQALRNADLHNELWIAFQPIVDIQTDRIIAFECLARWTSPELGVIGPNVFIAVAEHAQIIGNLTKILLTKALTEAASWPVPVGICFNLSAQDIISPTMMATVLEIVASSGIDPARLEFEITETAVLQDYAAAAEGIAALHEIGVHVSLDDFGTGFSSLGYVHKLNLDKIKIDRSFVTDVDVSRTSQNIIKTIVDLCHNLDLKCVVEGVETDPQLFMLESLGCTLVQGYIFGRPVPAETARGLIESGLCAPAIRHISGPQPEPTPREFTPEETPHAAE